MQTIQLSHEELLLLLSLLRLPAPLALGESPALGYSRAGLQLALAGATGSLAARDLLLLPADPASAPEPAPELADLVRAVAEADRCLVLATIGATQRGAAHITIGRGQAVLHSSPLPRVHRFERLPAAAIGERALASIAPWPAEAGPAEALGSFTAPAAALSAALDALASRAPATAQALLGDAAVPRAHAAAFIQLAGAGVVRHAIAAIRDVHGSPESRSLLAITCASATWCGTPLADDPEQILVRPTAPAELAAQVAELVAWL